MLEKDVTAFERHMLITGRALATRGAYMGDLRQFLEFARTRGLANLNEVGAEHVEEWLAGYAERGLAQTTMHRKATALRTFLNFAASRGIADRRGIMPPMKPPRPALRYAPTAEEIQAMVDAWPVDTFIGRRNRAILQVLWSTGCRRREVCDMELANLKPHRGTDGRRVGEIRVRGKGQKDRLVFVGANAMEALDRYLPFRRPDFGEYHQAALFLTETGHRMSSQAMSAIVQRSAAMIGRRGKITTHGIRHAFATGLLRAGANLFQVSQMLGHSNLSVTQVYLHLESNEAREAHEKFHPANRAAKEQQTPVEGS